MFLCDSHSKPEMVRKNGLRHRAQCEDPSCRKEEKIRWCDEIDMEATEKLKAHVDAVNATGAVEGTHPTTMADLLLTGIQEDFDPDVRYMPMPYLVIVEPEVAPELTESGIKLAGEAALKNLEWGVVRKIGTGVKEAIKVGDRFLYVPHEGHFLPVPDGKPKRFILHERNFRTADGERLA